MKSHLPDVCLNILKQFFFNVIMNSFPAKLLNQLHFTVNEGNQFFTLYTGKIIKQTNFLKITFLKYFILQLFSVMSVSSIIAHLNPRSYVLNQEGIISIKYC